MYTGNESFIGVQHAVRLSTLYPRVSTLATPPPGHPLHLVALCRSSSNISLPSKPFPYNRIRVSPHPRPSLLRFLSSSATTQHTVYLFTHCAQRLLRNKQSRIHPFGKCLCEQCGMTVSLKSLVWGNQGSCWAQEK